MTGSAAYLSIFLYRYRILLGDYTSFEAIRPTYERYEEKAWEKSHLNWMSYADLNHRLPELLLMRVDKMSMGVSLECRVPFLDHKFVELAMSIPQSKKTENDISKTVLKKAVRGIIPDELIDRKKQGFGVPVYDWFEGRLGTEIRKEKMNENRKKVNYIVLASECILLIFLLLIFEKAMSPYLLD